LSEPKFQEAAAEIVTSDNGVPPVKSDSAVFARLVAVASATAVVAALAREAR
jgi:hypothetical protein